MEGAQKSDDDLKKMFREAEKAAADARRNANKRAQIIGQQVKSLDKVTSGIKHRYAAALENLDRMRWEHKQMSNSLEFMMKARQRADDQRTANINKANGLRLALKKAQRSIAGVVDHMETTRKNTFHGDGERPGIRKVTKNLAQAELEALRGYSCKMGTTPGRDGLPKITN
eukprot:gnl/TRDRNA2_/TRDRNA2_178985_c0_seq1.p1 gnl/TRDRNA2_/TRDRNA2_178985_c0~~gnl/TRDRNA2_/TRDRNA2_178985_c0_seq1.p1  ORF type:complete len:171 (-),score=49.11 gnl/TRDRNA2_/TRDRNA2_178985_c0_seq1:88-600(-)